MEKSGEISSRKFQHNNTKLTIVKETSRQVVEVVLTSVTWLDELEESFRGTSSEDVAMCNVEALYAKQFGTMQRGFV